MRNHPLLSLVLVAAAALPAMAQSPSAVELVKKGVNVYIKEGVDSAITTWIKGSPLENHPQWLGYAKSIKGMELNMGKAEGFDIVAEHAISPRVKVIYFVMNYTKGALFMRFQAYESAPGNWVASAFKFSGDAETLFPASVCNPR